MPKYEIAGIGEKTGRKRKRVYSALTELAAREQAEADGTRIETVIELPPDAPTEPQKEYAEKLGISIPSDASKYDVSALISAKVDYDKPATARHLEFAAVYGIEVSQYVGKKSLFNIIHGVLSNADREQEMLAWFAFRVYRGLVKGAENAPLDAPDNSVFTTIAGELASDAQIVKSVRRYSGKELIWFGQWTAPDGGQYEGGSKRTAAYKRVVTMLRERVQIPKAVEQPRTRSPVKADEQQSELDQNVGLSTVLIAAAIIGLLGYFLF